MSELIDQSILNKTRKDKFILVLDVPKVLKPYESTVRNPKFVNLDKLQYSVYGTFVPKVSIPSEEIRVYGQSYNITSTARPNYSPITVNFNVDNNFENYWVLWKWLNVLNNAKTSGMDKHFAEFNKINDVMLNSGMPNSNKGKKVTFDFYKMVNDYTDYQTGVTIYGLREYNEKIIKFDYSNAFITSLGDLKYDYKDPNEMECSFDLAFNQLEVTLLDPNSEISL